MRISDWSSDVCSSDLGAGRKENGPPGCRRAAVPEVLSGVRLLVLVVVTLLALAGGFGDCRAEDVAQAGTGLGGAILGHRFLLLGDLALLDRQGDLAGLRIDRSEEHTSELQSLMRISYAVSCFNKQYIVTVLIVYNP